MTQYRHKNGTPWTVEELLGRCVANGSCMEWTGARIPAGYGTVKIDKKTIYTHRLMGHLTIPLFFDLFDSTIVIMHKCDNPPCINPEHLQLGDKSKNGLDYHRRGKHARKY